MDVKHPLDKAADLMGSQAALAKHLGVSRAAVGQWKLPDRQVPAEHCLLIERATGGQVRCEELRPDMAWDVVRDQSTAPAEAKA